MTDLVKMWTINLHSAKMLTFLQLDPQIIVILKLRDTLESVQWIAFISLRCLFIDHRTPHCPKEAWCSWPSSRIVRPRQQFERKLLSIWTRAINIKAELQIVFSHKLFVARAWLQLIYLGWLSGYSSIWICIESIWVLSINRKNNKPLCPRCWSLCRQASQSPPWWPSRWMLRPEFQNFRTVEPKNSMVLEELWDFVSWTLFASFVPSEKVPWIGFV